MTVEPKDAKGTAGTARIIPQYERVRRAIVREEGKDEEVPLPEGTDDVTAMGAVEERLQQTFKRDPGAAFTWRTAGPKDDGVMLVLRVPASKAGTTLDWEGAERLLKAWAEEFQ